MLFESLRPEGCRNITGTRWCFEVLMELRQHVFDNSTFSLETSAAHIREKNLFESLNIDYKRQSELQRMFIFYLVGTATFLYRPKIDNLFKDVYVIEERDPQTCHRYSSILTGTLSAPSPRRSVRDFIKGFGELLPITSAARKSSLDESLPLYPAEFNAHVMVSTLRMKIVWTDMLGAHLDFDDRTNTVYLFKYPTFCLMSMSPKEEAKNKTILAR